MEKLKASAKDELEEKFAAPQLTLRKNSEIIRGEMQCESNQ